MKKTNPKILMMAAGTGGHVFPAMAVANQLQQQGASIHWLGTPKGMENDLVADKYPFHAIDMQGLRRNGLLRLLKTPFSLIKATLAAVRVIKQQQIDVVVGFGGYVTAPGGLAAKLCGKPLIIHEQNAIAGMSNRYLAKFANQVLQAFDGAFTGAVMTVGNPVRADISSLPPPDERYDINDTSPLKILVVGGSLGAAAINQAVIGLLQVSKRPLSVRHQCGKNNHQAMLVAYSQANIDTHLHTFELLPFIDDMAAAYAWADVVVCRAGALTVTEIANVGLPAIFVPLPSAVDDHQTANAKWLTDQQAGFLLPQSQLNADSLANILADLDRNQILQMANQARAMANPTATEQVVNIVLKAAT